MTWPGMLREAWRDICTGTARVRGLAFSATVVALVVALLDMGAVEQVLREAEQFRTSGASISIMTAEGQISGERCDDLVTIRGVRAAGAVRSTKSRIVPTILPQAPIPVYEVTQGFLGAVGAVQRGAGVMLGPEATMALGRQASTAVATVHGHVRVGGDFAYPDDGRRPGFSYAAIAPVAPGTPFDECWVETWALTDIKTALLTTRTLSGELSKQPTFSQLNSAKGASFDGAAQFEQRITKWAGALGGLTGIAFGVAGVRTRRLSLAATLHAGVSPTALFAIVTLQTLAWTVLALALVIPAVFVAAVGLGEGVPTALPTGMAAACPVMVGGLAGAWLALATVHERHLFRYFKTR